MNPYPRRYHLDELTAHLVTLLERRRAGFESWNDAAEAQLSEEAARALDECRQQFRELADDDVYWTHTSERVLQLALPRYLKLAKAQHALEQRGYDIWRKGDFVSRATYAVAGLVGGLIVLRTALPDWLEPLPIAFFVLGPVLPEFQTWWAKRKYRRSLEALVADMKAEAEQSRAYLPLSVALGVDDETTKRQPEGERHRG